MFAWALSPACYRMGSKLTLPDRMMLMPRCSCPFLRKDPVALAPPVAGVDAGAQLDLHVHAGNMGLISVSGHGTFANSCLIRFQAPFIAPD